ncbi:hypothetical protein PoB_002311700, partial [Plakobranchus ocellatus]
EYTGDDEDGETSKVTSSPVALHDFDDTETDDETRDSVDLIEMCLEGKALSRDNFLPIGEVLDLLTSDTPETMRASEPLGRKENTWFWVENSDIRRKWGTKSQYWDDCGAWGNRAKQAHHLHCKQGKTSWPYMFSKEKENIVKRSSQN